MKNVAQLVQLNTEAMVNRIHNEDCLLGMQRIADGSIDFILCDLPFGTTANDWDKIIPFDKLWAECERVIKPNGAIALFANGAFTHRLIASNCDLFRYKWIWEKTKRGNFVNAKNRPMTAYEEICVFSKAHTANGSKNKMVYYPQCLIPCNKTVKAGQGKHGTMSGKRPSHKDEFVQEYTGYPCDILAFPSVGKPLHPTQKPDDLLEYLIRTYTQPSEIVLDNTCGSGSTLTAAINTGRKFIGFELDPKYYQIAVNRVAVAQAEVTALLLPSELPITCTTLNEIEADFAALPSAKSPIEYHTAINRVEAIQDSIPLLQLKTLTVCALEDKIEEAFAKLPVAKNSPKINLQGTYDTILADPPWQYDFSVSNRASIEAHYPTLTLEQIKGMKLPVADNAVLYLWATSPKLREALSVMEAWGFEYKSSYCWDKERKGLGYWSRGQHELLLVGTRGKVGINGKLKLVRPTKESSVYREERTEHSVKPNHYYDLIEAMFPEGRYLEVFARRRHSEKWAVWGNDVTPADSLRGYNPRVVDLFAGAGGMSLGLQQAEAISGNEVDRVDVVDCEVIAPSESNTAPTTALSVGLHDAEMDTRTKSKNPKFPNFALMKLSAWHKSQGNIVEWWKPGKTYDRVYTSKIFTFTPDNPLLPTDTIKGGTGYGVYESLPPEIDAMTPDYSIYPDIDYAIGFLTRGCPRKCKFCVVPRKEGEIRPYARWQDIVRPDTKKLVLMDNNILACEYGLEQLSELANSDYEVDCNQGLDARLVTPQVADILARVKWLRKTKNAPRYIRFSCDGKAQIPAILNAVKLLSERGIKPYRIFIYLLVDDIADAEYRVHTLSTELKSVCLYAQALRPLDGSPPYPEQMRYASYVNGRSYKKFTWQEYCDWHGLKKGSDYKGWRRKEKSPTVQCSEIIHTDIIQVESDAPQKERG
ncbi:MAG: MT-A70 family methyltransferase [Oscillospiraceae bacterium]|nr:MT-A70 family methyltransferase [Oscillospiraceae bacterium]